MPPLVSVIMPTFNRLQFLPAALASLFDQSYPHWELIVADDGSEAATRGYLQSLSVHPRVRLLWLPHSGRPAVARNAALRVARGDLVAFLDSDDLWLPEKLARQIASLREHPRRLWSYTAFALVNAAGEPQPQRASTAPGGSILERMLRNEIIIMPSSVVVTRAVLERLGAFDEELVMSEDEELWLRLAVESEIDGIDEPLTLIRRHGEHVGDVLIAWRDRRRVFEKALRTHRRAPFAPLLRRQRAEMAAGLAYSQACGGRRWGAVGTLVSSATYSWRYRQWWAGAMRTARAAAPRALRELARRCRARAPVVRS